MPNGSTTWINVDRTDYNYFVYTTAIAAGPLLVRLTALGGATLVQTLPEPAGGLVVQGTGQFP
jgi:expansin (peptidoglycan-binding protein)